jgi:two-component system sensor histidine kinase RpfC
MRRVLGVYQIRARDPDIEQSWLRVSICLIAFGYVWYLILAEGRITAGLWMGLLASVGDVLVGGYMIWTLRRTKAHVVRLRYLGIVADNTALTIGMAGAGEGGVAMIGIYLWVTIGNGFRFGPKYLLSSYWLSIVGFGLQLLLVPFWQQHRAIGVGLLLAGAIVPLYVLVLLIRLTSQKDAAEQLSNAKSRFVANVSHELRTPLTGVFAVYDLLRTRRLAPSERELIGMLGNAIGTLKTSVDAVLQMSKLEAGAERAERKPFNLWFFLHQLAMLIRPQSAQKGLSWTLHVDQHVPSSVVGDPTHLGHVLGNLLNNALKFTSTGGVSLRVVNASEGRIRFEVSDTGIGIPLDQQEKLFERFVQVDNSARRKFGGTGLGTSIARDLTELMGGSISVVSAPGQGSTFRVELPLEASECATQDVEWGAWRRVLVVGQPSADRDEVAIALRSMDLETDIAATTVGDSTQFDSQKYYAALLVMSANEAASYSESVLRDRAGSACPWLVVSPSFTSTQRASLIAGGAAGLLEGEISVELLKSTLIPLLYRLEVTGSHLPESAPTSANTESRTLNLLIADDNVSNRLLISRILTDAGHKVEAVGRGDDAFDAMAAKQFDLALLDLNMPDMCGPDVVKLFRASSVGGPRLPIVILSADATPAAKQESFDAGADEFLTKPVTAATLFGTIDRLLAGASTRTTPTPRAQAVGPRGKPDQRNVMQLVDSEQIQSLRRIARGDRKFLDQYVSAAFSDIERAISDLRVAVRKENVRDARSALHIIEGTAASVGASALVLNCKSIRTYITIPDDPDCAAALAELSTTYALTKSAVLAHLHPRDQPSFRVG